LAILNLNFQNPQNICGRAHQSHGGGQQQLLMLMQAMLRMMSQLMGGGGGCCGQSGMGFGGQSPNFGGFGQGCQGGGFAPGFPGQGMSNFLGGGGGACHAGGNGYGFGGGGGQRFGGPAGNVSPSFGTPGQSRFSGGQAQARGTGYYPDSSAMEGGYVDRKGKKLNTLQDFLEGRAPYVSVAMDHTCGIPYGQPLRIAELEKKYGRPIPFRVVDTGGAFKGRGTGRIDICTRNRQASLDPTVNGPLTLQFQ
jgi:hypothetical protein